MDNFEELKEIWTTAETGTLPTATDMMKKISQYRRNHLFIMTGMVLGAVCLTIVMIWVVFNYHSGMITTRIGEAFMLGALSIILWAASASLWRSATMERYSNREFLAYLKDEQRRISRFQKKGQVLGFMLATAGLSLYLYEAVHTNLVWMIGSYTACLLYFAIVWFVLRRKMMAKKAKKMNDIITKLEAVTNQINNN